MPIAMIQNQTQDEPDLLEVPAVEFDVQHDPMRVIARGQQKAGLAACAPNLAREVAYRIESAVSPRAAALMQLRTKRPLTD